MNFDDLLGLLVFIGIIVVSSVFRGLKEMKKKESSKETPSLPKNVSVEKRFQETQKNIPKRKVIIRTETEIPSPPLFPAPLQKQETEVEPQEDEEGPQSIQIKIEIPKKIEQLKKTFIEEEKTDTYKGEEISLPPKRIKIEPKAESAPTMVRMGKTEVSAPMERISLQSGKFGTLALHRDIGNIPHLQWAVIMMEVLSPPKALRDE